MRKRCQLTEAVVAAIEHHGEEEVERCGVVVLPVPHQALHDLVGLEAVVVHHLPPLEGLPVLVVRLHVEGHVEVPDARGGLVAQRAGSLVRVVVIQVGAPGRSLRSSWRDPGTKAAKSSYVSRSWGTSNGAAPASLGFRSSSMISLLKEIPGAMSRPDVDRSQR